MTTLPTLVATSGERLPGVLTYGVTGSELEIVSCDTEPPGQGIGRALVTAAVDLARHRALRQLRCSTTNDNLPALGFCQAVAFRLVGLRPGAVVDARRLKPSIPLLGHRGLPIRDGAVAVRIHDPLWNRASGWLLICC